MPWVVRCALAGMLGVLIGCFSEEPIECVRGTNGCPCTAEATCTGALICNDDANCISADCEDGTALCPCYGNDTCDGTLSCTNNICQPGEGEATSAADGVGTTATGSGSADSASMDDAATRGGTESADDATTTVGETGRMTDTAEDTASSTGSCEPPPLLMMGYGPCSEGACGGPDEVCRELEGGFSVCGLDCVEAVDCPLVGNPMIVPACIDNAYCGIPCGDAVPQACPKTDAFAGMTCIDGVCAFPVCRP